MKNRGVFPRCGHRIVTVHGDVDRSGQNDGHVVVGEFAGHPKRLISFHEHPVHVGESLQEQEDVLVLKGNLLPIGSGIERLVGFRLGVPPLRFGEGDGHEHRDVLCIEEVCHPPGLRAAYDDRLEAVLVGDVQRSSDFIRSVRLDEYGNLTVQGSIQDIVVRVVRGVLATWPDEHGGGMGIEPGSGFPEPAELVACYAARSERKLDAIPWYTVLACYKLGILLEGTHARACAGQAPKNIGDLLHAQTLALFERAKRIVANT